MELLNLIKETALPLVMSIFLAYIAYNQLTTNRNKLKLDLYNKRFEIYTSALKFYQELMVEGTSSETHKDFINKKEAAKFLFSKDTSIYTLLDEMHDKSFKINHFKSKSLELANNSKAFDLASKNSHDAVMWFEPAIKNLRAKLEPFLSF
ncbi:MAG: hypothetical protein ACI9N3_000775 [Colwellia sp.]